MNEQDLQASVKDIQANVENINRRVGSNWTVLWRGMLSGFGYVIGAAVAVVIIGWFLNVIGVIPAFKQQAELFRQAIQQSKK